MIATPTEIDHFIEVFRTEHISKAALRLGISQPTLTQSLKRLEEKLETSLFIRTKQGVFPTAQGKSFYLSAQGLKDLWIEAKAGVEKISTEAQGRFKVGCHQSVGMYTIPNLIKKLDQHAPKIEIDLVHDFSRRITEQVISFKLDLGYVVNPVKHPDLVLKKLGNDRVMFFKNKNIARTPKRIFADEDLNQSAMLLRKVSTKLFKNWTFIQTSSLELVRTLVLRGLGIGILPERVANADGIHLAPFDVNLPTYKDEIYLIYRKEVLFSEAGKLLRNLAAIDLL